MSEQPLIHRIISDLLIPEELLGRLIKRAPHTYKVYKIPKKSKGKRTIAQPARETKYIQHWLINNTFELLPVHEAATAYTKGSSIKNNALKHVSNEYISKFDFKDFFTSIKANHLESHIVKHLGDCLDEDDIDMILRLCCIKPKGNGPLCLSVGAPSSPLLSNSIMYEFDTLVTDWCHKNGFIYTRYADDLTFSTNEKNVCKNIEPTLRKIIKGLEYPVLRFNRKKTIHLSKKNQRRVTGLTLTNDGAVSIGRTKKREISALIHKYSLKLLEDNEIFRLQGLLGFVTDVEPIFMKKMKEKYGYELVKEILRVRKN